MRTGLLLEKQELKDVYDVVDNDLVPHPANFAVGEEGVLRYATTLQIIYARGDFVIVHALDRHVVFRSRELYVKYLRATQFKQMEAASITDADRRWVARECSEPEAAEFRKFLKTSVLCRVCGKPSTKHCGRCRMNRYCSRDCQVKDWSKHKLICVGKN